MITICHLRLNLILEILTADSSIHSIGFPAPKPRTVTLVRGTSLQISLRRKYYRMLHLIASFSLLNSVTFT